MCLLRGESLLQLKTPLHLMCSFRSLWVPYVLKKFKVLLPRLIWVGYEALDWTDHRTCDTLKCQSGAAELAYDPERRTVSCGAGLSSLLCAEGYGGQPLCFRLWQPDVPRPNVG
ncbi:hypothetical protein COCON_G00186710 [Conger conger]|uniref:Uncharacterized protein n=1 Tax=Conger conger TaxID=82655 RepID=A0A9Q1HRJ9_CONCO|nr:hypothetical protein COCON_G00186710 [Conger conger]